MPAEVPKLSKSSTKEWEMHKENFNTSPDCLTTTGWWTMRSKNASMASSNTSHNTIKSSLTDLSKSSYCIQFQKHKITFYCCIMKIKHPTVNIITNLFFTKLWRLNLNQYSKQRILFSNLSKTTNSFSRLEKHSPLKNFINPHANSFISINNFSTFTPLNPLQVNTAALSLKNCHNKKYTFRCIR